jgi:hypothetical protein
MSSHKHATKTALFLALALGAIAPAAASARFDLNPVGPSSPPANASAKATEGNAASPRATANLKSVGPSSPPANASAKATEGNAPSPRPTVQIVRVSAPGGFDWGDAAIGAAAVLGLLMLAVAGRSATVGKHRRPPATSATEHTAIPR